MSKEKIDPLKRLIFGGIAGSAAKTIVAPLDRVKILIQGQKKTYVGLSTIQILTAVYKDQGIRGLFQGNLVQLVRVFPYSALQFFTFNLYSEKFNNMGFITAVGVEKFLSGSLAGITACSVTYPLDVIRSRIAFQDKCSKSKLYFQGENMFSSVSFEGPNVEVNSDRWHLKLGNTEYHHYRGIFHAFYMIFKYENGIYGLYKGFIPTLIGMAPYAGTSFYTFGTLKNILLDYSKSSYLVNKKQQKKHLSVYGNLCCGSIAGVVAQTVSYPLDVVRRVMQLNINKGTHHKMDGKKRTWYSVMRKLLSKYGLRKGLFRGITINYIRVVPVVAVSFTVYETLILKF